MSAWGRVSLLALSLIAGPSLGADHGSLRVSVSQVNPSHKTNVQLKLNGRGFAAFSHSLSSPIIKPVTEDFLAKGTSTPMASDYGALQSDCRFRFQIEYSFGGSGWIPLGSFEAPGSQVSGSLPIGLCDGSLCSANPTIKAKLEAIESERWKKSTEALRKWLQDAVDRDKRETLQQKRRIEALKPPSLDQGRLPEDIARLQEDAALADIEGVAPPEVPSADDWWSARVNAAVEAGGAYGLWREISAAERFYADCAAQGPVAQSYCARYGGFAAIVATAEILAAAYAADPGGALAALEERQRGMLGGPSLVDARERVAQQRFQLQAALDAKRAEAIWGQVGAAARVGVGFSPLNDVADFCEALTGREFCVSSGRALSAEERMYAALGMIAGNRQVWDALGDAVRARILSPAADPKALSQILEKVAGNTDLSRKGAAHIFVGDFATQGGLTRISGGMHTEDAVGLYLAQAKAEGRALGITRQGSAADAIALRDMGMARPEGQVFRIEGSNGVSMYAFPRSAFPSEQAWERNVAVFNHRGQPVRVEGAKTVFPSAWGAEQVSDALTAVKNSGASAGPTARAGIIDGVPIRVGLDASGKIDSAYPTIVLPD